MFAKACEKAMKFTHPMVVSTRTVDGKVDSIVSTYFFVDRSGWALTAAHSFVPLMKFQNDQKHIQEIKGKQSDGAGSEPSLDPTWLTNHSIWFGADCIKLSTVHIFNNFDLAAMKLENVPPDFVKEVAVFGDADMLKVGTSLCKLGYPFITLKSEFIDNNFRLPVDANHLPPFPIDGLFSRTVFEKRNEKDPPVKYIETTTPGLKGQSGGPIFDVNGVVFGMQVKTVHMALGFAPTVMDKGELTTEHQFMNIGLGLHTQVIQRLLLEKNIPFETISKGQDGSSYIIN